MRTGTGTAARAAPLPARRVHPVAPGDLRRAPTGTPRTGKVAASQPPGRWDSLPADAGTRETVSGPLLVQDSCSGPDGGDPRH